MARRLGVEVVEHFTLGEARFGEARPVVKVAEYRGCWPEFRSTDEGAGALSNVATTLVGFWIPRDVKVRDAGDFLIWKRYPDEKYQIEGKVGRHITRSGRLRASYIPVKEDS